MLDAALWQVKMVETSSAIVHLWPEHEGTYQ